MHPFGVTRGARGAPNCPSVQTGVVTRLTRWLTTRPSRLPHRLADSQGSSNIQVFLEVVVS